MKITITTDEGEVIDFVECPTDSAIRNSVRGIEPIKRELLHTLSEYIGDALRYIAPPRSRVKNVTNDCT